MRRTALYYILVAVGLLFLFANCAYYNTFYNAQKYYRDGVNKQKANPSAAKTSFDKAIEKSALVISNYPQSKYTAEALFIIGMSYYYNKEYTKVISKFENLELVFPNSKFINEANLYWAICLIEIQEYNLALEKLQSVTQSSNQNKLSESQNEFALFKTAQLYFEKKDYEQAAIKLKDFVNKYHKSEYRKPALLMLGDALRELKNYTEAATTYQMYLDKLPVKNTNAKADTSSERIKGTLRLGQCLIEGGRRDEGMRALDEILKADTAGAVKTALDAKSYLELGKVFLKTNDIERARMFLKKVRTTPEIVEAYYLLGNSYESQSKFDSAKIYYDSVVMKKITGETTILAQSRLELLRLVVSPPVIENVKKDTIVFKNDTLPNKEEIIKEISEISIDTMPIDSFTNPPKMDSTLNQKPNPPEDTLFSNVTDTLNHILKDTLKPVLKDTTKPQIIKDTTPQVDSARVQFHLAEIYNLNLKDYERAIIEYEKVYEKYPQSIYAPKALFAQAWIYKNILVAQPDTSQYNIKFHQVLNNIINQYPNTDYAQAAQDLLKQ